MPSNQKENTHRVSDASNGSDSQKPIKSASRKNHNNKIKSMKRFFKRTITFLINKDNQPLTANIVAILMFAATIWLAIITLKVFNQTTLQTKASIKSANAAITADSLTQVVINDQRTAKVQSDISDAAKLKRDTEFIKKQTEGIDKQIESIKETQKEFEISHSPYIRVDNYKISEPKMLTVAIENQGNAIAWVLENEIKVKAGIEFKPEKSANELRKWLPTKHDAYNLQTLIGPGKNFGIRVPLDSISDIDMAEVKNGTKLLYVRALIYYFNTTTGSVMTMEDISAYNAKLSGIATVRFEYKKLKKYP